MKVSEIYQYLISLYPIEYASSFDFGKIGLQFGSQNDDVKKVLICLDVTDDVIDEAISNDCNVIISHHPFMFTQLVNLNYDSNFGKKLLKVFNNRINIMAFHTNFDVSKDGMNDYLAKIIGINDINTTCEYGENSLIRMGQIKPTTLKDFNEHIKKTLEQKAIRFVGDESKIIKKVSIVGGAGSNCMFDAIKAGCDCLITGQIPHHLGIEALENDFALIEVSHAVEYMGIKKLYEHLKEHFKNSEFIFTTTNQDPFKWQ